MIKPIEEIIRTSWIGDGIYLLIVDRIRGKKPYLVLEPIWENFEPGERYRIENDPWHILENAIIPRTGDKVTGDAVMEVLRERSHQYLGVRIPKDVQASYFLKIYIDRGG